MNRKIKNFLSAVLTALTTFLMGAVTTFAYNPNTGDDFSLPLVLSIAGGALLLIILVLVFTGKKGKKRK